MTLSCATGSRNGVKDVSPFFPIQKDTDSPRRVRFPSVYASCGRDVMGHLDPKHLNCPERILIHDTLETTKSYKKRGIFPNTNSLEDYISFFIHEIFQSFSFINVVESRSKRLSDNDSLSGGLYTYTESLLLTTFTFPRRDL